MNPSKSSHGKLPGGAGGGRRMLLRRLAGRKPKLLLEVSVYQCSRTLRFYPVGPNIV